MQNKRIIVFFAMVFLLVPHVLRYIDNNPLLFGDEAYYHLKIAESGDYKGDDSIIVLDKIIGYLPYKQLIIKILPFIFGILTVLFFYSILIEIGSKPKISFFASLFLISSPIFISTHTQYNLIFAPLLCTLIGLYYILKDKFLISIIAFCASVILNIHASIIVVLILLLYHFRNKKSFISPVLMILFSLAYIWLLGTQITVHFSTFENYITDLGSMYGFGIFHIVMALTGIVLSWKKKKEYMITYVMVVLIGILSLFTKQIAIFLDLFFAYFSGRAMYKLINANWNLQILKKYTIILIICGLAFSSLSYANRLSSVAPSTDMIESLEWLKSQDFDGKVLGPIENGFTIAYFADSNVAHDQLSNANRLNKTQEIYMSRDLKKTGELLNYLNIDTIWLTNDAREKIWRNQQDGLLFLLQNSNRFRLIYDLDGIEIWSFNKTYTP